MYRRTTQDASNIPESAFEFHGVRKGQGRPAEEAVSFRDKVGEIPTIMLRLMARFTNVITVVILTVVSHMMN
jgi:hypothetical protein